MRDQRTKQRPAIHIAIRVWGNRAVQPFQRDISRVRTGCGRHSEDDGLDEPVDTHRVPGQGDHAVGGKQAKLPVNLTVVILAVKDGAGDVVRGIADQDLQQPDRARVGAADGVDGDVPEPCNGLLRPACPGSVHSRRVAAELDQVLTGPDPGLDHVGGGLVQGQRQETQLGGDRCGVGQVLIAGVPGAGDDDFSGRSGGKNIEANGSGDALPVDIPPSGQHDMSGPQLAQQLFHVRGIFNVVQDQQPLVMTLQPSQRPVRRVLGAARERDRRAQPPGQRRQARLDLLWPGGGDPPHQLVLSPAGVSMLQRQLGFADPAQPVHRLRDHHAGIGGHRPSQPLQRGVTAPEHRRRRPRQVIDPPAQGNLPGGRDGAGFQRDNPGVVTGRDRAADRVRCHRPLAAGGLPRPTDIAHRPRSPVTG